MPLLSEKFIFSFGGLSFVPPQQAHSNANVVRINTNKKAVIFIFILITSFLYYISMTKTAAG